MTDTAPDPVVGERLTEAFALAVRLHANQARKGTVIPYVTHLMAVCSLALEDGATEDEAVAALLHDGPEDQGGREVLDEIARRFGTEVEDIVAGLSDDLPDLRAEKRPWRERKEEYLQHLPLASEAILRVSLADKLHNARSMQIDLSDSGDELWTRLHAGREEQAWYFGELLRVFEQRLPLSRNLPEIRRILAELFGPTSDLR